jgi:hypothetical protein
MADHQKQTTMPDLSSFRENKNKFPPEELARYVGQHVAWSPDGTRILASGDSMSAVDEQLQAAGIDPSMVVFDFVFPPDQVRL